VTFFHRSNVATPLLGAKQVLLDIPKRRLVIDVATRWNSSYDTIVCFLEQQPAVDAVLLTKDIRKNARDINTLTEDDITAAESVLKVIEPMKTVTTIMCSEKIPTVSMIHPLKEMILIQPL